MEDFQNGQHANFHADNSLDTPAPVQVPSALLPTVLQHLGLEKASGSPTLEPQKDLHSPDWQRRIAAIHALARPGAHAPLSSLLAALNDEDSSVRAAAIHVLGERIPPERLLAALHDTDWHVRETAVFTLSKLPQPVPPELLASVLQDSDNSVREAAQLAQHWLSPANSCERKPTANMISLEQIPGAKTGPGMQGQQMMSIQPPRRRQAFDREIGNMLKKDVGETMQEQEQMDGQEGEYGYYDGYRDDNNARWEKVTSYTPPKKTFSPWGIVIAVALIISVVFLALGSWAGVLRKSFTPSSVVTGALPTQVATPLLSTGAIIYTYTGHRNSVYDVKWSPDGTRIASVGGDGTIQVWNATTGEHVVTHRDSAPFVTTLAWSPDGERIASSAADDTRIEVWDAASGKTEATYELQAVAANMPHIGALDRLSGGCNTGVYALAWSPNGKELAAAGGYQTNGIVQMFDARTGSRLLTYTAHPSCVDALSWSPDGQYIVSGSLDGAINVWDPYTGKTAFRYTTAMSNDAVESLAWSPDGRQIALATTHVNLDVWDPFNGQNTTFNSNGTPAWGVFRVAWSPDGQRIATAGADKMVRIWDVATQNLLYTYMGHTDEVFAVAWSPSGKMLASGSQDDTVQVWRA